MFLHIISFIGADGADNAVIQFHGKITARDIGVYCTLNLCFRRRQWHSPSGFIAWQPIRLSTMLARMYNHCVPFRYPNVPEVSAAEGLINSMRPPPLPTTTTTTTNLAKSKVMIDFYKTPQVIRCTNSICIIVGEWIKCMKLDTLGKFRQNTVSMGFLH